MMKLAEIGEIVRVGQVCGSSICPTHGVRLPRLSRLAFRVVFGGVWLPWHPQRCRTASVLHVVGGVNIWWGSSRCRTALVSALVGLRSGGVPLAWYLVGFSFRGNVPYVQVLPI